jgi:CRP-like cAMP-binding protein
MKKILLIEDNLEVRENTEEILELANYAVVTAENGKIGVAKAIEEQPDIIICDIMMPELDGYGVLFLLSKNPKTAGIPFIFLTAKADKIDIRKGMNLGADDYLTKPFEEMDLMNAIETRLERSEKLNQKYDQPAKSLNKFYDAISSESALSNLIDKKTTKKYKKKEMVYLDGNAPNSLFFLQSGKCKILKSNTEGKELLLDLITPGEFFGYISLLKESPYFDSVQVMEDAEITIVPKTDFFNLLLKNRDVSYSFIKLLSNDLLEKEEELLKLAYDTVRKRVADALVKVAESMDDLGASPFHIAREDLANMAGTTTESVIRTLSEFKEDGWVQVTGRKMAIPQLDTLKAMRY